MSAFSTGSGNSSAGEKISVQKHQNRAFLPCFSVADPRVACVDKMYVSEFVKGWNRAHFAFPIGVLYLVPCVLTSKPWLFS